MKIVTVDDHALIREGLKAILMSLEERPTILEAGDGAGLKTLLAGCPDLDLILLDVQLPDCDGLVLLKELASTHPAIPVIVLSAEHETDTITRALHIGAAGFVPKTSINKVLISAIRLVLAGGIYVPPEAVLHGRSISRAEAATVPHVPGGPGRAAADEHVHHHSRRPLSALTERQWEVLWLLLEGLSNKQICRSLDLAEATVKVHVRAILRELGARSRAEAIVVASRLGIQRTLDPKPQ
jgi:DNA-binding NarL/FixJ family response regulator